MHIETPEQEFAFVRVSKVISRPVPVPVLSTQLSYISVLPKPRKRPPSHIGKDVDQVPKNDY